MASAPTTSSTHGPWLIAPLGLAGVLASMAVLVDQHQWNDFFHMPGLPASDIRNTLIGQGVRMWQTMLWVGAAAIALIAIVLHRICRPASATPPTAAVGSRSVLWGLAGLSVVALLVRSMRITESLWYDELAAWQSYGVHGPGPIMGNYFDPANHVAHTLLSWVSVVLLEGVLGGELALRVPALLASVLTVPVMYGLARHGLSQRGAWLAAGLTAVAPVAVLEGIEARGYSLMILLAAMASWLLLVAQQKQRPWWWLLLALVCAAGCWCHPLFVFVPLGHGVWTLIHAIRHKRIGAAVPPLLSLVLAAIMSAMVYTPIIPQVIAMRSIFAVENTDQPRLVGPEGWHALLQLGGSWSAWGALGGLAVGVLGLRSISHTQATRQLLAVTSLGLPVALLAVIVGGLWVYARFLLFIMPAALLAIAAGLDWMAGRSRGAVGTATALVLIGWTADLITRPPKQPLREAAELVAAQGQGTSVVVVGLAHEALNLYAGDMRLTYALWHGRELQETLDNTPVNWIILYYPQSVAPETYLLMQAQGFKEHTRFKGWVDWGRGDVVVYTR